MQMTISLPPDLAGLVQEKLDAGLYGSADELVAAAIARLDDAGEIDPAELGVLRRAWDDGVESGDAGVFDPSEIKAAARARLTSRS